MGYPHENAVVELMFRWLENASEEEVWDLYQRTFSQEERERHSEMEYRVMLKTINKLAPEYRCQTASYKDNMELHIYFEPRDAQGNRINGPWDPIIRVRFASTTVGVVMMMLAYKVLGEVVKV